MMSVATPDRLDASVIQEYIAEPSLSRGRAYTEGHTLFRLRSEGDLLRGCCQGSQDEPYRVLAQIRQGRITQSHCTCPVGADGRCKHVAALLWIWSEAPERFASVGPLTERLASRSRAELVALIELFLQRAPELEDLIDLTLPGADGGPVDPSAYRHLTEQIMTQLDVDAFGAEAHRAGDLLWVVRFADQFLDQGDPVAAASVLQGVVQGILLRYTRVDDDQGLVLDVLTRSVERFGQCLERMPETVDERRFVLAELIALILFDIELGGYGLCEVAAEQLLQRSRPIERAWIADEVRALSEQLDDQDRRDMAPWTARLLLQLEAEQLDDEQVLQRCRGDGLTYEYVAKLLELGRVEPAVEATRSADLLDLLPLADRFVEAGQVEAILPVVEQRARDPKTAGRSSTHALWDWLRSQYAERGRFDDALRAAEEAFELAPDLDAYRQTRDLAQRLEAWATVRPRLMDRVARDNQVELSVQIHLDEGEIDAALALVPALRDDDPLPLQIGEAAAPTRPREALRIFLRIALHAIDRQGRVQYQHAAQLLIRVRDLYQRLEEPEAWTRERDRILQSNGRRRALIDELIQAGLIDDQTEHAEQQLDPEAIVDDDSGSDDFR